MKIKDSLISLILAYFPKEKFKEWIRTKPKYYSNVIFYVCPSASSISDRIPSIQILESSKLLYPGRVSGGRIPHVEISFRLISSIPKNNRWKATMVFSGEDLGRNIRVNSAFLYSLNILDQFSRIRKP